MNIESVVKKIPNSVKNVLPSTLRELSRKELSKLEMQVENPVLIIIFDACRYDVFKTIEHPVLEEKELNKVYTDSSWTIPSHESIIRGSIPSNTNLKAFDILHNDYYDYRAPIPLQHDFAFAFTSVFFLTDSKYIANPFHNYFDEYKCTEEHRSADKVTQNAIEAMDGQEKFFGLLNYGETHMPWNLDEEKAHELVDNAYHDDEAKKKLKNEMKQGAIEILDKVQELEKEAPEGTQFVLTADHGTIIGEVENIEHEKLNVHHKKLFEVPLVTWVKDE